MGSAVLLSKVAKAKAAILCRQADSAQLITKSAAGGGLLCPPFENARYRSNCNAKTDKGFSVRAENRPEAKPARRAAAQDPLASIEKAISSRIIKLENDIEAAGKAGNLERRDVLEKRLEKLQERWMALVEKSLELKVQKSLVLKGGTLSRPPAKAPQGLSNFWKALPRATWSDDGKLMTLAEGTSFMGYEKFGDKMFIRESYHGMDQELKRVFIQDDGIAVVLVGNPGVGKSIYGFRLLYQWSCEQRRVVVVKRGTCPIPTLLTPDGAFKLDAAGLEAELDDPDVRYLVDSLDPSLVGSLPTKAKMVVISSPNRNEVCKGPGYVMRYFDTWSLEELLECWSRMFAWQSQEEVQERFYRWGGVPRYVLEKLDTTNQNLLERAIGRTDLTALKQAVGDPESPQAASHKLLHLRANPDFQTTYMEMASPYVQELVAFKLWENESLALELFLSAATDDPTVAGFRGNLFEGFCHRRLKNGGTFRVRDLASGSVDEIVLQPTRKALAFASWQEVEAETDDERYFQPLNRRTAAVDGGMQPDKLFQFTVSAEGKKNKGLVFASLRDAVRSMKNKSEVKLFFVLPPDQFFEAKEVKIAGSGKGMEGVAQVRKVLKQFALEISFKR
ncbi:hypothetical protein KFL_008520010 [Klebsormidium nitens]|uniref:Uncharacterized protein n=1 Tax=Klebsormidium nitens TaxID=105231 RepID=A0A1Y1ILM0_KLENI|nr:hypothetical protein KFL_008520010 [Klebsormidium nitens]|eukprot:GAQ91775.1 hypothetical protein KFL_008520010 [Klebsormidium nitens]